MALARAFMQLPPIFAALRRHKTATMLIILQVALTLAVTANALTIVATRVIHFSRDTGTDEAHLFVIRNGWKIGQNATQIEANVRADLQALRHVAGVQDVFASQTYPLAGANGIILAGLKLQPDQKAKPPRGVVYLADDHALDTLGVRLEEGRNFRPDEIGAMGLDDPVAAPSIIITRDLANKLFANGAALGKTVYLSGGPSTIVGIVGRLQSPLRASATMDQASILLPALPRDSEGLVFLIRAKSATLTPVIAASLASLEERGGLRVIDPKRGVVTLAQAREDAYDSDRSVAMLLSIVCGLLLLATAGGIVGLSSFWVSQRRTQIGIRRSLGASRGDILRYFHAENFLIVTGGAVLGFVLAMLVNIGLMKIYALQFMPLYVPLLGALVLWVLGQLAVWGPAVYAAKVPPVVAIRAN